jgi:hypothetical protein
MFEKFDCALERHGPICRAGTDAVRLVNGQADGFDDLILDSFAGRWLLQTKKGIPPLAHDLPNEAPLSIYFTAGYSQGPSSINATIARRFDE